MSEMENVLEIVSKNVRTYRESKGLTQQELAELSGLHRNYIVSVEKGDRNLTVVTLTKIANALNVEIQRLFDEEVQQEL